MRSRLSVLLVVLAACGEAHVDPRPDIVLVSIDSLRPDHLGCYGYPAPTSPNLDELASAGVRFTNAVSTTSWTLPAHAALFTGLYDSSHGLVDNGLRLGAEHHTLAEALREAGYLTAGFYGGPYLHPTFGLSQGFDVYESCMAMDAALSESMIRAESRATRALSHADVTGPRTVERVTAWLSDLPPRGERPPFFLFIHLWDVHYDFIPPPGYVELFDPDYSGAIDGVDFMDNPEVHPEMDPRDLEHLLALYDAEIRFTDDMLGALRTVLAPLTEPLFVVTADHGEEFFEHGRKGHRNTLFEEVVRVPLVVHWPGHVEGGRVVEDQVRLIDLMPTLLALSDTALDEPVQGRDLSALLSGSPAPAESALLELLVGDSRLRALRTNERKVMAVGPGQQLLYDLVSDPAEASPVSDSPESARWVRELRRARKRAVQFRDGLGARAVERVEMDPDVREQLSSLGYLGDEEEEEDDTAEGEDE